MRNQTHMRAVQSAAEIAGGTTSLAVYLNVSPVLIAAWIQGTQEPPAPLFLRIVEILLGEGARLRGEIPTSEAEAFKHRQAANT